MVDDADDSKSPAGKRHRPNEPAVVSYIHACRGVGVKVFASRRMPLPRIALIGDHNPAVPAHRAIPLALNLAGQEGGLQWTWIGTDTLGEDVSEALAPFAGVWCVPASPYVNTDG